MCTWRVPVNSSIRHCVYLTANQYNAIEEPYLRQKLKYINVTELSRLQKSYRTSILVCVSSEIVLNISIDRTVQLLILSCDCFTLVMSCDCAPFNFAHLCNSFRWLLYSKQRLVMIQYRFSLILVGQVWNK